MSEKPDDDFYIALALLHGCEFYTQRSPRDGSQYYYVDDSPAERAHPVERYNDNKHGTLGFKSRAELARAYCEYYGLLK